MKTIIHLLCKNIKDPSFVLLSYIRAIKNASGFSPTKLLMSRKIRTRLPVLPSEIQPVFVDHDSFTMRDNGNRYRQAVNHN